MILVNLYAANIPATFLLDQQRADELCKQIEAQTEEWSASEKDSTTADLYARFINIAKTPNEQLYVTYQFGMFIGSNYLPNLEKAILNEITKNEHES